MYAAPRENMWTTWGAERVKPVDVYPQNYTAVQLSPHFWWKRGIYPPIYPLLFSTSIHRQNNPSHPRLNTIFTHNPQRLLLPTTFYKFFNTNNKGTI